MVNLYQILGVPTHADTNAIYQTLLAKQHELPPKVVQAVQQYLLNPEMRVKYDEKLSLENPHIFQSTQPLNLNKANVEPPALPTQNPNFNPYQAPTSMATPQIYQQGAIYNPKASMWWSLLFTPLGAYLHAKNWETLGNEELARQNMIWVWSILGLIVGVTILEMLVGIKVPNMTLSILPLVFWYRKLGVQQVDFVEENFGDDYERLSLVKPVLIGVVGGFLAFFVLFWLLSVIFAVLGILHPNFLESP